MNVGDPGGRSGTSPTAVEQISAAFARSTGHGLLHLGAAELGTELDPSLALFRELGR